MSRADSFLEESLGAGDWTLNASKTATVIAIRGEGASATTRGLADKKGERASRCGLLGGAPARSVLESQTGVCRAR